MRMNAESVFINAIELMLSNLRAALDSFDLQKGERVVVVPHQPSAKLLKALVATGHSEFPDVEFLNNLSGYGNVISASVPTVLSRLDEVLEQNGPESAGRWRSSCSFGCRYLHGGHLRTRCPLALLTFAGLLSVLSCDRKSLWFPPYDG